MIRSASVAAILIGLAWMTAPFAVAQPAPAGGVTTVELTVVGGPALNPNAQGRPSPVVVRIFDLAATGAFEAAKFETLFEHSDSLKRDLLAQEEFVLRPGDIQERNRDLKANVYALGVAAAFRDMDHAVWQLTVPLKPGIRNFLLVHVDQNRIRLETIDPK